MKWQHLSSLPSPVNGTVLLEEAEITLIMDKSAETKVVVDDDVALGDAELFRSRLGLRRLLRGDDSSPEIFHGPFELAGDAFDLYQRILRLVSPDEEMRG